MIKACFYDNACILNGHAQAGPHGSDIVCAGVSAIVIGALNWFNLQTTTIIKEPGHISIILDQNKSNQSTYLQLIETQLQAIAQTKPKHLQITRVFALYRK